MTSLVLAALVGPAVAHAARMTGIGVPLFAESSGQLAGRVSVPLLDERPSTVGPFTVGLAKRTSLPEVALELDLSILQPEDGGGGSRSICPTTRRP